MAKLVPKTPDKHLGIEIEMFSKYGRDKLVDITRKMGLSDLIDVGTDGSIECGEDYIGVELRVLTKRKTLFSDMKRVKMFIKKVNGQSNETCGLHVHLDCRNTDSMKVFANLIKKQTEMFEMVNPDRKDSEYCQPIDKYKLDELTASFDDEGDHYDAINVAALSEHQTIEIRMHEGTTDCTEIYNWCRYLYNVAYGVKHNEEIQKYIKSRKDSFDDGDSKFVANFTFDVVRAKRNVEANKGTETRKVYF